MKKILLLLLILFIILFFSCQSEPVDLIKLDTLNGEKTNFSQKDYILYGDFKWIYSIYAPPRFWEAAQTKTINLVNAITI